MGLCNGCDFIELVKRHKKHRDRLVFVEKPMAGFTTWPTVYLLDEQPVEGQGEPYMIDGKPARFVVSYASLGHSNDEDCWMPKKPMPRLRRVKVKGKEAR